MYEMLKTMNRRLLCAITMLAIILLALAPAAAYAADNPLRIAVKQVFVTSSAAAESIFTYMLKPLEPGNPMPAGSTAGGYTFTITGNNSIEIGPLSYSQQRVFRYELFQVIGTEKPGYTYDKRTYVIEVYTDAERGADIIVRHKTGAKAGAVIFENAYNILPSDPSLMVDPPVKKSVFGNPEKDSMFTFRLAARNPTNPMPAGSVNGVKTITVAGSGEGEFGTWSYDAAGTYYYTISEINTGEKGYTYDTAVYTITDTVKEENGRLIVSRVVTNESNKQVTTFTFINKFSGGGGGNTSGSSTGGGNTGGGNSSEGKPGGDGPKTGDNINIALYYSLLVAGGALAISAITYLLVGGKGVRREKT